MVSTKAGWIGTNEIVEVVFDPKVTPYAKLLEQARCVKDASVAYVYDVQDLDVAKQIVGKDAQLTKAEARVAKASDQKYYLRSTPYFLLPLTEVQAARINAAVAASATDKSSQSDPRKWLSPSQRALLTEIEAHFEGKRKRLQELTPARDPANFASYTALLRRELAK